jgi:hypothetical protein
MQWYYQISGEDRGPISSSELRAQVRSRVVTSGTLVRRAVDDQWIPVEQVPGLMHGGAPIDQSRQAAGVSLAPSQRLLRRSRIKTTAIGLCDEIDDAMSIIRGLLEYYDLNKTQIATICEIISPIAEQLKDLEQDLP